MLGSGAAKNSSSADQPNRNRPSASDGPVPVDSDHVAQSLSQLAPNPHYPNAER